MTEILELSIERPVAGGRMLARHEGRIVFVAGAIPGERVRARVERVSKQSVWAAAVEVVESSPDRRAPAHDPACGGAAFAHIAYARQLVLKQQILVDAFRRLAHATIEPPVIAGSPEHGYRIRAHLHAEGGRLGFYLEGTHTICDAASTSQLLPASTAAAAAAFAALGPGRSSCAGVIVSENIAGTARVLHLDGRDGARLDDAASAMAPLAVDSALGISGVTTLVRGSLRTLVGEDAVVDDAAALFGSDPPIDAAVTWRRRAPSFFQGNRHLIGRLARRVVELASGERVADLYAGVGLFAIALAARGIHVIAVEAEPFAAEDLALNAKPFAPHIQVQRADVEQVVANAPERPFGTVVLDPPRTGVSPQALAGVAAWKPDRIVYVSCDPPTLARDAARLIASGYALRSVEAFDLFPNTPHVEAIAVFDLAAVR